MTIAQLIEHLQGYGDQDEVIAYDLWLADDVLTQARDTDNLTRSEAEEVLTRIEASKDATVGITWEVLDCHIDNIVQERD